MNISKRVAVFALISAAGMACAQDTFVSGLLHTAVGGATLGPANERRLPVHNLGSSGQDGVEVKLRTSQGGGIYVDLTSMAAPPNGTPQEVQVKYKGWDGTIKCVRSISGSFSNGFVQEMCDFSMLGPPGTLDVEVTCRTRAGDTIVLPIMHSSTVAWTTHISYGPGEQFGQGLSAGKASFSDLSLMVHSSTRRPARLEFLVNGAMTVVSDVVEVSCRPICIVAPCPGDWTNLESMIVTGSGMAELAVYDAGLEQSTVNPPLYVWPFPVCHARGTAHLNEQCCGDVDDDGIEDRVLIVNNIGSSGQDGVAVEFPKGTMGARRKWGNGHVTLMKFTDEAGSEMRMTSVKDPVACTSTFTPDFSSLGARQYVCILRDQFGNVLESQVMDAGQYFTVIEACSTPFNSMMECRKAGGEQTEFMKVTFRDLHTVTLSNGVARDHVKWCEVLPSDFSTRFQNLAKWTTTSLGGDIYLGELETMQATPPCPADFNGDGAVDFFDYLDFVDAFSIGC